MTSLHACQKVRDHFDIIYCKLDPFQKSYKSVFLKLPEIFMLNKTKTNKRKDFRKNIFPFFLYGTQVN